MTTNFILAPGEDFIQCPYNTAHQITNARLLTHLDKCRRAFVKDLSTEARKKHIKICRHNAMHHIPVPELRFHEERCVDAFAVVRHLAYHNSEEAEKNIEENRKREAASSSSGTNRSETKPVRASDYGLEEEDWEAESTGYAAGYDPQQKLEKEVVLYTPAGLTKSERKTFRKEVRQKAQESMLKGEPVELPTAATFEVKPNIRSLKIKEEEKDRSSEPEQGEIEDEDDETQENDNRTGNSGYSRSSCRDRSSIRPEDDDDYSDSDDFEGYDPYGKNFE